MVKKIRFRQAVPDIISSAIAVLLLIIFAYPLLYTLFASVSEPARIRDNGGLLLYPLGFNLRGYKIVFQNQLIWSGILNSVFYMAAGTCLNMFLTAMGGYVLSRKNVMLNPIIMKMIVFTMFFSGGIIPLYLLVSNMMLIDSRLALILPVAVSQWNLILLKTAYCELPGEILESAKIDGCNDFYIMFKIATPLIKPTFMIILMYYAVGHWNSWYSAMVFLRSSDKFPLQLVLREILIINDSSKFINTSVINAEEVLNLSLAIKYCTCVVSMIPMAIMFPLIQRHFTTGVMLGSLKS